MLLLLLLLLLLIWGPSFKNGIERKKKESEGAQSWPTLCDPMEPTRFLRPWNFPGESTGVGCHFLLRGSSWPRDQTRISHIAGRCFTIWATREAMDRTVNQLSCVSWVSLHGHLLIMSLAFFYLSQRLESPEQCKWYSIPRSINTAWVTAALKVEHCCFEL